VARPQKPIDHGTKNGYAAHKRRPKDDPDHEACAPCKQAWTLYYADRRQQ